jgi:hypothetical protein
MSDAIPLRAVRLLILQNEGAVPHDWLCEAASTLRQLSAGRTPTDADLRYLATLESIYAAELVELG